MPAFPYQPEMGSLYAQSFALSAVVPPQSRLFYVGDDDCTNFISQCVWAAYGGWIPALTAQVTAQNRERIKKDVRQVPGVWFGSANHIGSNAWCRVVEFFDFVTRREKTSGPAAVKIAEGGWNSVDPSILRIGDVLQMVVKPYMPNRYGHALYLTSAGGSWDSTRICCHTYDRLNTPLSDFSSYPEIYPKIRALRFGDGIFMS